MSEQPKTPKARSKKSSKSSQYYEGVGRRKSAVARVRVYATKKGEVTIGEATHKAGTYIVNNKPLESVFQMMAYQVMCRKPLRVVDALEQYVVTARVSGGGLVSQTESIVLGLARALAQVPSDDLRTKLKSEGLMTRDARTRERRMVGTGGKSRRLKQSPKR